MVEYIVKSKEDTRKIAEDIASKINKGSVITLTGTLGAGKTFFTECFINYFNKKENRAIENVVSPTFNLVKVYNTDNFDIYHFDLYRLKNREEVFELGIEDAFENVALIEWPELILDFLPENVININIKLVDDYRVFDVCYSLKNLDLI